MEPFFDARLLERLALSNQPKARNVYDVAFVVNIVVVVLHSTIQLVDRGACACFATHRFLKSIVVKADKHITHWQTDAYGERFVQQFRQSRFTKRQMQYMLYAILCCVCIVILDTGGFTDCATGRPQRRCLWRVVVLRRVGILVNYVHLEVVEHSGGFARALVVAGECWVFPWKTVWPTVWKTLFQFLGYQIVGGRAVLEEFKLVASILQPERWLAESTPQQAAQAVGISYNNRGCNRHISN